MTKTRVLTVLALVLFLLTPTAAQAIGGGGSTGGGPATPAPVTPPPISWGPPQPPAPPGPYDGVGLGDGGCHTGEEEVWENEQEAYCAPKVTYTLTTWRCGISVTGYLQSSTGPNPNSGAVRSAGKKHLPQAFTPFGSGADRSKASCAASWYAPFSDDDSLPGYYLLVAEGQQANCTWRDGSDGSSTFQSCGPSFNLGNAQEFKLTRWCGGVDEGVWSVRDFSPNACAGSTWSCAPVPVSFDGQPVNPVATVLDDGVHRRAAWGEFGVTGPRNVTNVRTQFTVDPNSSPYRGGPLSQQPMEVALTQGADSRGMHFRLDGDVREVWVGWQQASDTGRPSVLNRTTFFDAEFPYTQTIITGYDLKAMKLTLTTRQGWMPGEGRCSSAPLTVQVNFGRTIN